MQGCGLCAPAAARKGFPLCHRNQASSAPFEGSPPPRGTCSPRASGNWVAPTSMPPLASCPPPLAAKWRGTFHTCSIQATSALHPKNLSESLLDQVCLLFKSLQWHPVACGKTWKPQPGVVGARLVLPGPRQAFDGFSPSGAPSGLGSLQITCCPPLSTPTAVSARPAPTDTSCPHS